jgi:hypothetical protein
MSLKILNPVTEALVNEALADLRNPHPLVSKLTLQRFASQLRRLRSSEMEDLKATLLAFRVKAEISVQEQEALTKMYTLVEAADENRRLRTPRMTAPLTATFPVVGRSIGEASGE